MAENARRAEIEGAIGAERDLLLLVNAVGFVKYYDEHGKRRGVSYGLCPGSPDLVGILAPWGAWFCLEVKDTGGKAEPHQKKMHALWRTFGAYVETVDNADDARAALARARLYFARKNKEQRT